MLIKLTCKHDKKPRWYNPARIDFIDPDGETGAIIVGSGTEAIEDRLCAVLESPSEIAALCSPQDATRKALTAAREALEVATTPLPKDRQKVLAALAAIKEVSR